MRVIAIIFLVIIPFFMNAQRAVEVGFTAPDYKRIEAYSKTADYKNILNAYLAFEDSLTLEDYRNIYYGYIFYSNGSLRCMFEYDSVDELLKRKTNEGYTKAEKILVNQIKDCPLEIGLLQRLRYCYEKLENTVMEERVNNQIEKIFQTMLSTGDGASPETAIYVINTTHEYNIMRYFGLKNLSQSLITAKNGHKIDLQELGENDEKIEKLYFDVDIIFTEVYGKMFDKKSVNKSLKKLLKEENKK